METSKLLKPNFKLIGWCRICGERYEETKHLRSTQCPKCRKLNQSKGGRPRKDSK